jgi:alginate O-acetyltransferase complex protein AlgI
MLPIAVVAIITWVVARSPREGARTVGIVISAGALGLYKYGHFLATDVIGLVNPTAATSANAWLGRWLPATPPLAISFFTFEFVHYLVEVRRGGPPLRNPIDFALFAIFFPSLAAGPIKRYREFVPNLHDAVRATRREDLATGLLRVATGYAKKLLIADNLTAYIDATAPQLATISIAGRWLWLGALAVRILADFSGYSDIAIGCARLLGVRLPENFDWPYLAWNLQAFWNRWHMSLTSWIRDYVYIPLGGNRVRPARRIFNAFTAMALCGLWHGAAWHYVAWGVYHGIGLAVSASYATVLGAPGRAISSVFARWPVLAWAGTLLFVCFGWLLFFYPVADALRMTRLLVAG